MKKKILSLLLVVAMCCTMFSSTAFAADSLVTPGAVASTMTKTVDYYAGKTFANLSQASNADIAKSYYPSFLVASSGVKSDKATALLNQFKAAVVADDLSTADVFDYAGIIATLTVMGESVTSVGGKNLLSLFDAKLTSDWGYGVWADIDNGQSPYNFVLVSAVLNYYSSQLTNATMLDSVKSAVEGYYCADGYDGTKYLSPTESNSMYCRPAEVFNDPSNIFSGYTLGTLNGDNTAVATAGDYFVDSYSEYRVNASGYDALITQLQGKVKDASITVDTAADYFGGYGRYITVTAHTDGTGAYFYGFSADNDAKFAAMLKAMNGSSTIISALMSNVSGYTNADGTVDYDGTYGANADSTGMALAANALLGNEGAAKANFRGLLTFFNGETGAFQTSGTDNLYATKDALEGMVCAYRAFVGEQNMYALKAVSIEGKQEETHEIIKEEGASFKWDGDTSKGLSFRSDAEVSKFLAVLVDDSVVDAANYTVEEGSTIITLKPEYLASLGNGNHSIKIQSTDGFASADFTVAKSVVNTGDASSVMVFVVLAMMAMGTFAVVAKKKEI